MTKDRITVTEPRRKANRRGTDREGTLRAMRYEIAFKAIEAILDENIDFYRDPCDGEYLRNRIETIVIEALYGENE